MPAPSAAAISARSASRRHHRPGRIGRTADQHALRAASCDGPRAGPPPVSAWRVSLRGLDQHRLAAERGQDVTVRRIARHGDRHAVARLEHREERQDEAAGRAGRDDDPRRVDVDSHRHRGNAARCARAARRCRAPRYSRSARVERRMGGRDRGLRRRRRGLPDLHVNDMAAGRLDPRGGAHHVHHHERRNIAADRGRKQVRHALSQCRFTHGYLLFQPPNRAARSCSAGAPD